MSGFSTVGDRGRRTEEAVVARGRKAKLSPQSMATFKKLFVQPMRQFASNAGRKPAATAVSAFERAYDRLELEPERVTAAFAEAFELMKAEPSALRAAPLAIPRTIRRAELCALIDKLDARYPGAASMLISGGGSIPKARLIKDTRTWQLDAEAALLRGELRSQRLQELARHGLEQTYRRFNRVLLQMHWAIHGESFQSLRFGREVNLVKQLQLAPSATLDIAARLRNAAAHDRWDYDPTTRRLVLHDEGGWSNTFTLSGLHATIRRGLASVEDLGWASSRTVRTT